MKVLGDFWCNGLHKSKGEVLTDEDIDTIGENMAVLIMGKLIEEDPMIEEQEKSEEEVSVQMVEEKPKKKSKKG